MDSDPTEVALDVPPFLRVYKNGKVERLIGTEIVPPSPADPKTGVQSKDVVISTETGVSARLYKPRSTYPDKKIPLLVYFHGGAFFAQSSFSPTYQPFLNTLAAEAHVIIVSVDYRRAPEHPLPIGYDDSWAAINWVASHSSGDGEEPWLKDFADFESLFFAGDSAGANIAHHMAIRVGSKGLGGGKLVGIVLMHPYFWGKDPVGDEEDEDTKAVVDQYWMLACPSSSGSDDPWINPVKDPNLSGLGCKKVLVFVAEMDVLRGRGLLYCEALEKSGWGGVVDLAETQGEEHVFHLEKPHCEKGWAMVNTVASFMSQDIADLF